MTIPKTTGIRNQEKIVKQLEEKSKGEYGGNIRYLCMKMEK
jgi:hypothetical protein